MVAEYFEEPGKSLALAAVQSGVGVAGVFYPYLLTFLLDMYGLQSTFLITGGIFLNSIAASLLYRQPQQKGQTLIKETTPVITDSVIYRDHSHAETPKCLEIQVSKSSLSCDNHFQDETTPLIASDAAQNNHAYLNDSDLLHYNECKELDVQPCIKTLDSLKQLFRNTNYMLFLFGDSLVVAFANGFIAVIVDIFTSRGYSADEGLFAFLPYFLASIFGRLLPGILQQNKQVNPLILPVICALLGVLGQLSIFISSKYSVMMFGSCLSGLSVGGAISSSSVVAIRLVAKDAFPVAFGLVTTLSGILSAVSAPLNGKYIQFVFYKYALQSILVIVNFAENK